MDHSELRAVLAGIASDLGDEQEITITGKQVTQLRDLVSARDTEIGAMEKQLEKFMVRGEALMAITKAGGNVRMLMPHVQSAVRLRKNDDGQREIEITDGRMTKFNRRGNPMTIEDFVAELQGDPDFACCFGTAEGGRPATSRTVNGNMKSLGNNIEAIANGEATVDITHEQAKSVRAYRFAKAEAEKLGVSLRIVD